MTLLFFLVGLRRTVVATTTSPGSFLQILSNQTKSMHAVGLALAWNLRDITFKKNSKNNNRSLSHRTSLLKDSHTMLHSLLRIQALLLAVLVIPAAVSSSSEASSPPSACHGTSLNCLQDIGDDSILCHRVKGCLWMTGSEVIEAYYNTTGTKYFGHCESDVDQGRANASPCHTFNDDLQQCLIQGCDWSGTGAPAAAAGEEEDLAMEKPPEETTPMNNYWGNGQETSTTTSENGVVYTQYKPDDVEQGKWQTRPGKGVLAGFILGGTLLAMLFGYLLISCIQSHHKRRKRDQAARDLINDLWGDKNEDEETWHDEYDNEDLEAPADSANSGGAHKKGRHSSKSKKTPTKRQGISSTRVSYTNVTYMGLDGGSIVCLRKKGLIYYPPISWNENDTAIYKFKIKWNSLVKVETGLTQNHHCLKLTYRPWNVLNDVVGTTTISQTKTHVYMFLMKSPSDLESIYAYLTTMKLEHDSHKKTMFGTPKVQPTLVVPGEQQQSEPLQPSAEQEDQRQESKDYSEEDEEDDDDDVEQDNMNQEEEENVGWEGPTQILVSTSCFENDDDEEEDLEEAFQTGGDDALKNNK